MSRDDRYLALASAAGRAYDVVDRARERNRRVRVATRHAAYLEWALIRILRLSR